MVSGADVHVALQAGLWAALADDSDRAAVRSSCSDARAMADMMHDTAVLPVVPDTLCCAASIAAYHRRLVTLRALHVRYGAGCAEDDALHFMEAYSAAVGAALPATHCSIDVPAGRWLPVPFAALLLRRVVPDVERLAMALGSYGNLAQLLQALEPCPRLRAFRLLPASLQHGLFVVTQRFDDPIYFDLSSEAGVLDALCKLAHLHTLSGPWWIEHAQLKRLCDALPSLTTLGFQQLSLLGSQPCACISRQLHTLTACADGEDPGAASFYGISAIATALPALQQLNGIILGSSFITQAQVPAVRDTVQRFAACAGAWTLRVWPKHGPQHVAQGLPAGCLAPLQHLDIITGMFADDAAADVTAALGCLVSAAPNLATVRLVMYSASMGWDWPAMVAPLRQAPHLHTLRLEAHDGCSPAQQAAALEAVVCSLVLPGAAGEATHRRALRRVLLHRAPPDALDACRRALERDGITVRVDTY